MKNFNGERFAVVIPTYGRPDRVFTHNTLRKCGYTGDIYLLCDDSDKSLPKYQKQYGDKVLVFNKDEVIGTFDRMDNFDRRNVVVYARNAIYQKAREAGLRFIAVLDDDYTALQFRVTKDYGYYGCTMKNADKVFAAFLDFLDNTQCSTICFAQGGDFIGGAENKRLSVKKLPIRKMMNLYFFDVERPVEFMGTINEDLTASVAEGIQGRLVLTTPLTSITQKETQSNAGGLTEIYLDLGTYVKSFYSVMYAPSAVKVASMGSSSKRLHHSVEWKYAAAKVIRETV
jgi:hypothetical protein